MIKAEEITQIVVGVSEGDMKIMTDRFVSVLRRSTSVPIVFQDETLTSHRVGELLAAQGKRRDHKYIDDLAACEVLQEWIEERELASHLVKTIATPSTVASSSPSAFTSSSAASSASISASTSSASPNLPEPSLEWQGKWETNLMPQVASPVVEKSNTSGVDKKSLSSEQKKGIKVTVETL